MDRMDGGDGGGWELRVRAGGEESRVVCPPGETVRGALEVTRLRVRTACGGVGACGLCRIRVGEGPFSPPTRVEGLRLGGEALARGERLACQAKPMGPAALEVLEPAPPCRWHALPPREETMVRLPPRHPPPRELPYGVAVDLGTTHLRVALWDLVRGRRIAARGGLNPQAGFGADVLTRLAAAAASPATAVTLGRVVRRALGEAVGDILARELGRTPGAGERVGEMVVVGNSAMLDLLAGGEEQPLLAPDAWERPHSPPVVGREVWAGDLGLPHVGVTVLPGPGGFVGSDLLAAVVGADLLAGEPGGCLIDFGTNTEIALWDGETLWVTSAAGGPAFEGSGLSCGLPAEPGAIWRIEPGEGGGAPRCRVIGGGPPRGVCGSGLVDGVALLLAGGAINRGGRFRRDGPAGLELATGPDGRSIRLLPGDVDLFQRAKAGVGAGLASLLERAGMGWGGVTRVCVGGAFGRYLEVANARAVGLLPPLGASRVELYGNLALAGCQRLLLTPGREGVLEGVRQRVRLLNMAQLPGFDHHFVEELFLRPMGGGTWG